MIALKLLHTFIGPSPYASDPVIVISMEIPPEDLVGAAEKMRKLNLSSEPWFNFPQISEQPDALEVGRFMAAWTLAMLNEVGGNIRVAQASQQGSSIQVVLGYHHHRLAFDGLTMLTRIFHDGDKFTKPSLTKVLKPFWQTVIKVHPDFQAKILMDYARKAGIPFCNALIGTRQWLFGWGARSEVFFESSPMTDSGIGKDWATNKQASKYLFKKLGAPQAPSVMVEKETDLAQAAQAIGFPCVTKPLNRGKSIGVTTDIRNQAELLKGFQAARKESTEPVMIERHVHGENFRLLVVRGKFWKAIYRERPTVIGDGKSSVLALAEALKTRLTNELRPGSAGGAPLLDDAFHQCLRAQNLLAGDIPAAGRKVAIREIPLALTGARVMKDVTHLVHPDTVAMCVTLAKSFKIDVCGIDLITPDISKSCLEMGVFLEINNTPGIRTPVLAGVDPDEVGRTVLGPVPGRIPFTLIVAPESAHAGITLPDSANIGWARGKRTGVGHMAFRDEVSNAYEVVNRLIRHPEVNAITVIVDPAQFTQLGLPVEHTLKTIVHPDAQLTPEWRKVLEQHTDEFVAGT